MSMCEICAEMGGREARRGVTFSGVESAWEAM